MFKLSSPPHSKRALLIPMWNVAAMMDRKDFIDRPSG
jgi:hypothetical protein